MELTRGENVLLLNLQQKVTLQTIACVEDNFCVEDKITIHKS